MDADDRAGLAMAAALVLSPGGEPPTELAEALVEITATYADENPVDLAAAFGCGWQRGIDRTAGGWYARWDGAIDYMVGQVASSVQATATILANQLPQFALSDDDIEELPDYFAVAIVFACDCGYHQRTCRQRCGGGCCSVDHALTHWNPKRCHLRAFVDQAVRGTARPQILGGAFADSMLYKSLERDGRILRRFVEAKQCPTCETLYEASQCEQPGCGPVDDDAVLHVAVPNRLILPEHEGGNYREVVRWVCGDPQCRNLFEQRVRRHQLVLGDGCPRCGWQPGAKAPATKTLWVRVALARPRLSLVSTALDNVAGSGLDEEGDDD
ncbi:MAG: hypothetical protein AB7L13_21725 [Acidimicrobiia bacterium]